MKVMQFYTLTSNFDLSLSRSTIEKIFVLSEQLMRREMGR